MQRTGRTLAGGCPGPVLVEVRVQVPLVEALQRRTTVMSEEVAPRVVANWRVGRGRLLLGL